MKVVDIAQEIYVDAGNPTSTSIPAIAYWIRSKIGAINNLLYESFTISKDTYEVLGDNGEEISPEAVAVIKQMYRIYDYELQIRANLNLLATDSILQVEDNGSSVTRVNRNEVSKTLASIRKNEIDALENMVTAYRCRSSEPSQIAGDDTIEGIFVSSFKYLRV